MLQQCLGTNKKLSIYTVSKRDFRLENKPQPTLRVFKLSSVLVVKVDIFLKFTQHVFQDKNQLEKSTQQFPVSFFIESAIQSPDLPGNKFYTEKSRSKLTATMYGEKIVQLSKEKWIRTSRQERHRETKETELLQKFP